MSKNTMLEAAAASWNTEQSLDALTKDRLSNLLLPLFSFLTCSATLR